MPATEVGRYLRLIREACPEVAPRHSTLPAFFREAEKSAGKVPVRRGELREPSKDLCAYLFLIANCVSSRVRMKQANDEAQAVLRHWAEPMMAVANAEGAGLVPRYLRIAWEHVLLNR